MATTLDMSAGGLPLLELPGRQPFDEYVAFLPRIPATLSPMERKWAHDSKELSPGSPCL